MKNIRLIATLVIVACALSACLSVFGICKSYSLANSYDNLKENASDAISALRREIRSSRESAEAEGGTVAVFAGSDSADTYGNLPEYETEPAKPQYRIQAYDGKIAVFDADDRIIRTINTDVDLLPDTDKELLTQGILTSSREEMLEIVADYAN